jgi:hypothetical protein
MTYQERIALVSQAVHKHLATGIPLELVPILATREATREDYPLHNFTKELEKTVD